MVIGAGHDSASNAASISPPMADPPIPQIRTCWTLPRSAGSSSDAPRSHALASWSGRALMCPSMSPLSTRRHSSRSSRFISPLLLLDSSQMSFHEAAEGGFVVWPFKCTFGYETECLIQSKHKQVVILDFHNMTECGPIHFRVEMLAGALYPVVIKLPDN